MDLEKKAIERIKIASEMSLHHYGKPLLCTYSGGKDSDVLLELFRRSGVPYEVRHSHTTVDAPPTVYHVRQVFKTVEARGIQCNIDYHVQSNGKRITMWDLIVQKRIPPTRQCRYCCDVLKENGGKNRYIATGVRWAESHYRSERDEFEKASKKKATRENFSQIMLLNDNDAKRRVTELCMQKREMIVNPIIDWRDSDIWDYIASEHICVNPLYAQGWLRVGCIGCPKSGNRRKEEFGIYPTYKRAYIRAFGKMLEARKRDGKDDLSYGHWTSAEAVFDWYMEDKNVVGQMSFNDFPGWMPEEKNESSKTSDY